jgi:2-oxoglutarate ferredoxin oxidoreductase subunit beta
MSNKKWDIEKSRDDFKPQYLQHPKFSAEGHGQHPMDKYLRPGRIPHIWCSGCGLGIAMTCFIKALEETGLPLEKNCVVSGIGCTGRVAGYLNVDSYHTTHGRPIPFATGLKLGNPDLTVSVFSGDGDLFAIGGNHFIHAARRNVDINVICVNNFNYGMTGGQGGPTTHINAKTTTTPYGNFELPFNLPHVAIASGAVYVARWTTLHARRLKESIKEALERRGFTFVEIISPCPTAYGRRNKLGSGLDEMKYYKEHSVIKHNADPAEADLSVGGDILIGKFKDEDRPTFLDLHTEGVLNKFNPRDGGER